MSNGVFRLDGKDFDVLVTGLTRNFEVADSDATGRTADWKMHRDVIGTFYNYTLKVEPKQHAGNDYNDFYDAISAPVESHALEIPYGGTTLTFQAYVTKGKDDLFRIYRGKKYWAGLSINFIAMEPQRKA